MALEKQGYTILRMDEERFDLLNEPPDGDGPEGDGHPVEEIERRIRVLEGQGPLASIRDPAAAALLREAESAGWDAIALAETLLERLDRIADSSTAVALLGICGRDPRMGALVHRTLTREVLDRVSRRR